MEVGGAQREQAGAVGLAQGRGEGAEAVLHQQVAAVLGLPEIIALGIVQGKAVGRVAGRAVNGARPVIGRGGGGRMMGGP